MGRSMPQTWLIRFSVHNLIKVFVRNSLVLLESIKWSQTFSHKKHSPALKQLINELPCKQKFSHDNISCLGWNSPLRNKFCIQVWKSRKQLLVFFKNRLYQIVFANIQNLTHWFLEFSVERVKCRIVNNHYFYVSGYGCHPLTNSCN
jgi:hypothetical protein